MSNEFSVTLYTCQKFSKCRRTNAHDKLKKTTNEVNGKLTSQPNVQATLQLIAAQLLVSRMRYEWSPHNHLVSRMRYEWSPHNHLVSRLRYEWSPHNHLVSRLRYEWSPHNHLMSRMRYEGSPQNHFVTSPVLTAVLNNIRITTERAN